MPMQISISNAIGGGGGSQGGGSTPAFTNTLSTLFDGQDDRTTTSSNISRNGVFTFSFWFKFTGSFNTSTECFPWGLYNSNSSYLALLTASIVRLKLNNTLFTIVEGGGNNIPQNTWAQFTLVRNASNSVQLYLNGETFGSAISTANPFTFNSFGRVVNSSFGFKGNIDESALWYSDETSIVARIYNSGLPSDLSALASAPQNWWRMGDGSTYSTIKDSIGTNPMAMVNMSAANFVADVPPSPFQSLYSYDFDGNDDTFAIQSASAYAFTGDFTIMAWVNVDAIGNNHYIIDTSTSASFGNGYSFRVRTDGKIRFWSYQASQTGLNSATALSAGSWYHIACVHTSTQNKIYINGSLDATLNWSTGHSTSNTTNLKIASSNVLSGFTEGHIDEVAFFNNDQSANISAIYNSGTPTDLSSYSPLGWFRMGENAAFTSGIDIWTMTSVGSQTNTALSENMSLASRTTDVPPSLFANTLSTTFDANDASVSLVSDILLGTTSSVSFWIKRNDTAIAQPLGCVTAWSDFLVRLQTTQISFGRVPFIFNNATTLSTINQTTDWTHLLFVRTGATCNLYVNGVDNDGAKTNANASWINKFRVIGAPGDGTTWAFDGLIDEVSLFTTALSSSDATAIYNGGVPTSLTSYSPLGWWRMGDGSTYPTINDIGSGSNNGTMVNMSAANFVSDVPT